jgi:hypothetical protein
MSAQQIDSCMEAIIYSAGAVKQPWMRLVDAITGESLLLFDEAAIRNLRAACDAALGEGEEKCPS